MKPADKAKLFSQTKDEMNKTWKQKVISEVELRSLLPTLASVCLLAVVVAVAMSLIRQDLKLVLESNLELTKAVSEIDLIPESIRQNCEGKVCKFYIYYGLYNEEGKFINP